MKKLFTLFVLAVSATMAMAALHNDTIVPTNFMSTYYNEARSFALGNDTINYTGVMYNTKGTPAGFAGKQLIQLRSDNGTFYSSPNTPIEGLKQIKVIAQVQKNFAILFGSDSISSASITTTTEQVTYTGYTKPNEQPGQTMDAVVYTFVNPGTATSFRFVNGNKPTYIFYVVITSEVNDDPTAAEMLQSGEKAVKFIKDGQIYIRRGEHIYSALGELVK